MFTDRETTRGSRGRKEKVTVLWNCRSQLASSLLFCWFSFAKLVYPFCWFWYNFQRLNMVILTIYIGMVWLKDDISSWINLAFHKVTCCFVKRCELFYKYRMLVWLFDTWNFWFLSFSSILHRELAILDCNFPYLLPFKFSLHRSRFRVLGI